MENFVLWFVKFALSLVFGFIGLWIWYFVVVYIVMPLFDLEFIEAAIYYTAFSLSSGAVYHGLDKHSDLRS